MTATTPYAPAGHHTVTPYVIVKNAREAIAFYARAFGAEQISLKTNDSGRVMHAEIRIGDSPIMLTEEFDFGGVVARSPLTAGSTSMHFYLYLPDVDARFARAREAGAREVMPVTEQPVRGALRRGAGSVRTRLVAGDAPGLRAFAIITSVDLTIAMASSPRRSFRARTASVVITDVSC